LNDDVVTTVEGLVVNPSTGDVVGVAMASDGVMFEDRPPSWEVLMPGMQVARTLLHIRRADVGDRLRGVYSHYRVGSLSNVDSLRHRISKQLKYIAGVYELPRIAVLDALAYSRLLVERGFKFNDECHYTAILALALESRGFYVPPDLRDYCGDRNTFLKAMSNIKSILRIDGGKVMPVRERLAAIVRERCREERIQDLESIALELALEILGKHRGSTLESIAKTAVNLTAKLAGRRNTIGKIPIRIRNAIRKITAVYEV